MFTKKGRAGGFLAVGALVATLLFTDIAPASASTTTVTPAWTTVQTGEPMLVTPDTGATCPPLALLSQGGVYANITAPGSSALIYRTEVSSHSSFGVWSKGYLTIPDSIPNGSYDIEVVCLVKEGGGVYTVRKVYDKFTINVTGNDSGAVLVDRTNLFSTATFSSATPCQPNDNVEVRVYGGVFNPGKRTGSSGFGGSYIEASLSVDYVDTVTADNSGHWSVSVPLIPDAAVGLGGLQYPGVEIFFKAICSGGSHVMTNPYKFILGNPRYVALGDSYSSGTGAFNYDVMGVPCYRSTDSYAYYISSELSLDRPDLGACHGAVTHDVLNVSGAAIAQVDRLSADTELVTLTIGGNDVGFQSVLNDCVARNHQGYGCASNPNVTLPLSERMLALAGEWNAGSPLMVPGTNTPIHSIADVLEAITIKAPNAEVYIAGYPRLFGEDSAFYTANFFAPGGYYCTVNTAVLAAATAQVSLGDASWLNSQADTLNAIIENAVEDARMLGKSVHFVSPHNFDTHGLCDSGSAWLNDVEIGGSGEVMPESFHPTTVGMALGYGDAFIDRMN